MSLAAELQNLHVKASKKIPSTHKAPCLVLGNLLGNKIKFDKAWYHLSPLEPIDNSFEHLEFFAKYEVGSEEGVLALLLNFCHVKSDDRLEEFLHSLDIGYISAECSVGEEEIQELALKIKKQNILLYICEDLEHHERALNIAKLLSMCQYYCNFDIVYEKLEKDLQKANLHIAEEVEELGSYDGAVVYFVNGHEKLFGSNQFAMSNRLKDNDRVLIKTKTQEFERTFVINSELKGTISLLEDEKYRDTYAYEVSKIVRIADE